MYLYFLLYFLFFVIFLSYLCRYLFCFAVFFFSSRRRHTRCALVTGVQTCALPIFKHLRPVWLEMFKKDPGFLADDPAKAALLFRPLLARQELQLPGFITAEPGSSKYGVSPLSEEEVQQLTGVPAFDDFRESHPNLFIDPSGAQTAPPASGDEAALTENLGEVVIHLAALPGKMMFDQDTVSIPEIGRASCRERVCQYV